MAVRLEQVRGPDYSPCIIMYEGDVFESIENLAHCVSADFAMGSGIAYEFKCEFGGVQDLFMQKILPGGVAMLSRPREDDYGDLKQRFIYNLVTKVRHFDKPKIETFKDSLEAMREHALLNGVRTISTPLLGCGLDLLKWNDVYRVIHEVFHESGITIHVYVLPRRVMTCAAMEMAIRVLSLEPLHDAKWRDERSNNDLIISQVQCGGIPR